MKILLSSIFILLFSNVAFAQGRTVAVTIDDLPVVTLESNLQKRQMITKHLLQKLKRANVPAIGFVNEGKLYREGVLSDEEVALLREWVEAGFELGNHTYSHMSLHSKPFYAFRADTLKGEIVLTDILGEVGKKPRYFRHPYLFTGTSMDTKKRVAEFLGQKDYIIAPVTIDNGDWIFARAYDNSLKADDELLKNKIAKAYITYLDAKTAYWEQQSQKIFDREIPQILLLHANRINADHFDKVARMLEKRGYSFNTLDEALKDEAYLLPDHFLGRAGISWLHRWALDMGKKYIVPNEPRVPKFVMKAAGVNSE